MTTKPSKNEVRRAQRYGVVRETIQPTTSIKFDNGQGEEVTMTIEQLMADNKKVDINYFRDILVELLDKVKENKSDIQDCIDLIDLPDHADAPPMSIFYAMRLRDLARENPELAPRIGECAGFIHHLIDTSALIDRACPETSKIGAMSIAQLLHMINESEPEEEDEEESGPVSFIAPLTDEEYETTRRSTMVTTESSS